MGTVSSQDRLSTSSQSISFTSIIENFTEAHMCTFYTLTLKTICYIRHFKRFAVCTNLLRLPKHNSSLRTKNFCVNPWTQELKALVAAAATAQMAAVRSAPSLRIYQYVGYVQYMTPENTRNKKKDKAESSNKMGLFQIFRPPSVKNEASQFRMN